MSTEIKATKRKILPPGMSLYPFQRKNLNTVKKIRRCLIADEMGLGKSAQAIALCNFRLRKKIVVICPASLRLNWKAEFEKWDVQDLSVFVLGSKNKVTDYANENVFILSYHGTWNLDCQRMFLNGEKFTLIIDECHRIKNWGTNQTRAVVMDWASKSLDIIALSGTPMTKHVPDLHPIVSLMQPGKWGKFKDFCERYCNVFWDGYNLHYEGVKNEEELKKRLGEFMVRNLKVDVLPELPSKIFKVVPVEISSSVAAESMKWVDAALLRMGGLKTLAQDEDHIAVVRRKLGEAKVSGVVEYVKELREEGVEKVVLFAHHKVVVEALRLGLVETGLKVGCFVGGMRDEEKDAVVRGFQAGELDVFLGSIMAASVGLTLTAASDVVFAELDWTPAVMAQAVDRVHRIGQDRGVVCHMLVGAESLDEAIVGVLEKKMETINKVIG